VSFLLGSWPLEMGIHDGHDLGGQLLLFDNIKSIHNFFISTLKHHYPTFAKLPFFFGCVFLEAIGRIGNDCLHALRRLAVHPVDAVPLIQGVAGPAVGVRRYGAGSTHLFQTISIPFAEKHP